MNPRRTGRATPAGVDARAIMVAAALVAAWSPVTHGSPTEHDGDREWNFRVLLGEREIGWHRYRVRGAGSATEVASDARFDVQFLRLTAYRYRHTARERWRDACLDGLESRTETNGEVERVAAAVRGDALVVASATGERRLAGCVMSFAYWDPRILGASRLLNPQTGEVLPVQVVARGTEAIDVGGGRIEADRHRLTAPGLQVDLWYADGRWVALEAPTAAGRRLRYELQ